MKKLVITALIVFAGLPLLAQEEVHLPPAVLAAGGSSDGSSTSFYRWRLSMVHIITLSGDFSTDQKGLALDDSKIDWLAKLYPNPVRENLYVEFELAEAKDFVLKLTDITGRTLMIREAGMIAPDEIIELNLSKYSAALYLLNIKASDHKTRRLYRIQKI